MHVYGVSMRSSVSQQLVVDHLETVRKLVLSSPSYIVGPNETATLYTRVVESAGDPSLPEGQRKEAEAILAWEDTYDDLSGITNEVMLLVGTDDVIIPDSIADQMAGEIEGSWLVRFKGIPHVGPAYAPEEYGGVVLTFLGTDESPG